MTKRGHEVEITWFKSRFEFAPFLLKRVSPPPNIDIIHANCQHGFAFHRKGIPLVVTEHHCIYSADSRQFKSAAQRVYHEWLVKRYSKASSKLAQKIIAVSNHTKSGLLQAHGEMVVSVIYNWVDTETFKPAVSAPRRSGAFRLLFVGNLTQRKGADLLRPIMEALGSDFELTCVSGLRGKSSLAIGGNIHIRAQLSGDALIRAYQEADALLFPTRLEGLGYVALEAMACGKPVIASNNSALPEVVENGVTGLLCETGNVEAFISACRLLAEDESLRLRMGNEARRRVESKFAETVIVPQYERMYRSVVSSKK